MRSNGIRLPRRVGTVLAGVLVLALGAVLGGATVALSAGTLSSASAGNVTAVKVVRDANPYDPEETGGPPVSTFGDIPGASVTMTVPAGTKALLLARFSATSTCVGPDGTWCGVRIVINGIEAKPNGVNTSIFDSGGPTPDTGGDNREAHMIERSLFESGGTYVVKVQTMVSASGMQEALVNWNLTVERVAA
jgi:hypothetical protein